MVLEGSTRDVLKNPNSTVAEVISAVKDGWASISSNRKAKLGISASSVVGLLELFIRRYALLNDVAVDILEGNYDDPVGDMDRFVTSGAEFVVLLPFLDSLWPGFEAELANAPVELIDAKIEEVRNRYALVFQKASSFRLVIAGLFHRSTERQEVVEDVIDVTVRRLNETLRSAAAGQSNVKFIDMSNLINEVGRIRALDFRFYFRNRAPYSPVLLDLLSKRIFDVSRSFGSDFYKVVVLDCDNTLWGGVIGEDLVSGVKLGPHDYPGNIFWRIQHSLSQLEKSGILLCLCSKNNHEDVDQMFDHPNMVLRRSQIVLQKVNWSPKPENIKQIAAELNVGLDSLIFLDDSDFEIEAVKAALPSVRTFRVPTSLDQYPSVLSEIYRLCVSGGIAKESISKTEQYRIRAEAETLRISAASHEDYLRSLELRVTVKRNDVAHVGRISELTQKSNQFNLTTIRYTEHEINKIMAGKDGDIFSLTVTDKFGSSGLTGVIVLRYQASIVHIDAFLMSCRVIGRGIEFAVWPSVIERLRSMGYQELRGEFIASAKNAQVADFYDRLGMTCVESPSGHRSYASDLLSFAPNKPSWIEVDYVG